MANICTADLARDLVADAVIPHLKRHWHWSHWPGRLVNRGWKCLFSLTPSKVVTPNFS